MNRTWSFQFFDNKKLRPYLCQDMKSSSNWGFWQGEPNIASCLTIGLAQKYKSFPTERFGRTISWRFRNLLPAPFRDLTGWFDPRYIYLEPKLSTEEISLAGRNFNFHRHTSWDFTQIRAYLSHFRIAAFSCNSFWQASPDGTEVRGTEQPPH